MFFDLLEEYYNIRQQIFDYFGYVEDWRVIPFDDCRQMFWMLEQDSDGSGSVFYHETKEALPLTEEAEHAGQYYQSDVYTQRHLPKWVYRGEKFTMICTDPGVDGNKFLSIFDNEKEIKA